MNMRDRIQTALQLLDPQHVEMLDESHMHGRGLETHFKVVLASPQFAGLNAAERHQKICATLGGLMSESHALALHIFTPEEWNQAAVSSSPACCGGSKHDIPRDGARRDGVQSLPLLRWTIRPAPAFYRRCRFHGASDWRFSFRSALYAGDYLEAISP